MPSLDDEVKIRIKRKEEELMPSSCIYPLVGPTPKLTLTSPKLICDYIEYTPANTSPTNRVMITAGDTVTAEATIANETGDGTSFVTLLMVGYLVEGGAIELARSSEKWLADGRDDMFSIDFLMPDENVEIVLASYHDQGEHDPCLMDMSSPFYAAPTSGDPLRNVIVGNVFLDEYAHEWKVPVELVLAPGSVYADEVQSKYVDRYRFGYTVMFTTSADKYGEVVDATTTYPLPYGEEGKPSRYFHSYVPMFEDWGVPGMRGEVILSSDTYPKGAAFRLQVLEFDWELETFSYVGSAEQIVYLGEKEDNKFIITTPRDDNISVVEITRVPLFNFNMINPASLLLNLVLGCKEPPCTFTLTEADKLVKGKEYAFISSHSIDPGILAMINVPNESIYKFEGVQEIEVEPIVNIIAKTFCTLLDIDPKSTDCINEIITLADPLYIADAASRTLYHTNLVGNEAYPDALDIPFVALALATGAVPAGGAGRKLFGRILKGARNPLTRELNTVGLWIEKNMDLISASIVRGYKSDVEMAVGRLAKAADEVSGSSAQLELLDDVKRILEESIEGTNWNTAVGRTEKWVDEITQRLGAAGSKTPPKEVIEPIKRGVSHIPGLKKINIDDLDTMEKTRKGARASKGTIEHEGVIYDIDKIMVKDGKITQYYKPRLPGLWNAMQRHKYITAGLFSWFVIMGPWFTIDNTQFIIYLLRAAGVLPGTWGAQWEDNAQRRFDAYMQLKDDNCEHTYQAQYLFALEQLRELIDIVEPIPKDKIEKARYVLSVLYGFDIGDPNEVVKAGCETDFDAWNHWYYEITRGCTAPLEPSFGFETTEYPKPRFRVKVESIVDGDTIWVSSTDPEWPHTEGIPVRMLGYNTPDKDTAGSTILGYSVRRKDIPEKDAKEDPTTPVLREDYYAPTTFITNLINKQHVWIEIDPNNQLDKYDRLLATVEVDHEDYKGDLGEDMLRKGYAMVFFYTPNGLMDSETRGKYLAAETIARNAKLGVWSGDAEALPTGNIKCDSTPNNAYIYIDKETAPRGVTDSTLDDITIGDREVEFRGLTYSGVECKDCKCGYSVIVKEDEKETVICNMSAICEIMQPKWGDEGGIRWNRFPSIWLDDGITKSSLGAPDSYPFKITFGKDYSGLNTYTLIKNGHGFLARDCDFGEWRIELRLDGFKNAVKALNMKPGVYKKLIPKLEKGTGEGPEIEEEEPELEEEKGVGYLTINRPVIAGSTTEVPGQIKVHVDGLYISRYAGYGTTKNIKCCTGCYCNDDKDLGDCSLGTHTLKLTKTGYEEWSDTITLVESETTTITAEMTPADGSVTGAIADIEAEDIYAEAPSRFSATVVNTGIRTACYRMKFNFNGISPEAIGNYYEYPIRFEDVPDDGWSVSIEPGDEVVVAVSIMLPKDAIPAHAETARYDIGTELQVAEIF